MAPSQGTRTTTGRGRLFESILDTVGDTPVVRVNNTGVDGVTLCVTRGRLPLAKCPALRGGCQDRVVPHSPVTGAAHGHSHR